MSDRYLFIGQYVVTEEGKPLKVNAYPELICYGLERSPDGFPRFKIEGRDGIYSTHYPGHLVLYTEENLKLLAHRDGLHARIKELTHEVHKLTAEVQAVPVITYPEEWQ